MTDSNSIRVAHIVPAMDIGGVEVAIARSHKAINRLIDYRVFFVRRSGKLLCDQRHVVHLLWDCTRGRWRPDIVVTSLWWSHPFGIVFRLLGVSWISFFHNSGFKRRYQKAVLSMAWRHADGRFVDSDATGEFFREIAEREFKVIPYIFRDRVGHCDWLQRRYDLIWVGRPVLAKRTDLAARFLRRVAEQRNSGRVCLVVAGNIPKEFKELDLGPEWTLDIRQSLDNDSVWELLENSRFYLLTSEFEGMSMSTIDAIYAGCVPVVRIVGELEGYIGTEYELAILDSGSRDLSRAVARLSDRWLDADFASVAIAEINNRLSNYSTYEHEFTLGLMSFNLGEGVGRAR